MDPKTIRQQHGLSLIAAAVGANVAEGTARVFEANPNAVGPKARAKLLAFYANLARKTTDVEPHHAA